MKFCTCFVTAAGLAVTLALLAGCTGPRLAERPLTSEQQQWAESMEKWHPSWQRPYVAPVRYRGGQTARAGQPPPSMQRQLPPENNERSKLPDLPSLNSDEFEVPTDDIILIPVDDEVESADTYQVKKGETLSSIAADIYGNANAWRRLFEANDDVLNSPDDLIPGMILKLPPQP